MRAFDSRGTCEEGVCSYESEDLLCAHGCQNGQCIGEPCAGVVCDEPPPVSCEVGGLRVWDGKPGSCTKGFCDYNTELLPCADGCSEGQCKNDPCVGVICDDPPAGHCVGPKTELSYTGGTCVDGICEYSIKETPCDDTCERGKCYKSETPSQCQENSCGGHGACDDTGGVITCKCDDGWSGESCDDDIDECQASTHTCHAKATCTNTHGAFICTCNDGYQGDGKTCTNIDGCKDNPCSDGVTCTDVPAPGTGYTCGDCPTGYEGDSNVCTPINDCKLNPCKNGTCVDEIPGFSCTCDYGFGGATCDSCAATNSGVEECDSVDNNCNGTTDEGTAIACGGASPNGCGPNHNQPCPDGANQGACKPGTRACDSESATPDNPVWLTTCVGSIDPTTDTCDEVDNDCDGQTDEDFDKEDDPSHCGGCNQNCATNGSLWPDFGGQVPEHAETFGCSGGSCVILSCQDGWENDLSNTYNDCNVPYGCGGVIVFPNEWLDTFIRSAIDKPTGDIVYADVSALSELNPFRRPIDDLSGIQCLTGLTELGFFQCSISDISKLSTLTGLIKLNLSQNNISNINALSGLTNLTHLDLQLNKTNDISSLSELTNLAELVLFGNSIKDISPLSKLNSLTKLELFGNSISDISALVNNAGIDSGDTVDVSNNPLDCDDPIIQSDIATLQNRGVDLQHDCP